MSETLPLPTTLDLDAHKPAQIADLVEAVGVAKTRLPVTQTLALALLAGAFIAFGAMFWPVAMNDSGLGFGSSRVLGGSVHNLVWVTLGNNVGGAGFIGLASWVCYRGRLAR